MFAKYISDTIVCVLAMANHRKWCIVQVTVMPNITPTQVSKAQQHTLDTL